MGPDKIALNGNIISTHEMDRSFIEAIIASASRMQQMGEGNSTRCDTLSGKIVATLFQESSLRTRLSFETAAVRLGARVLGGAAAEVARSNSVFYESLQDMARIMSAYADLVVLRHPTTTAIRFYAMNSSIPVINAGSGQGPGSEHPTQSLTDLFTIYNEFGTLDGLRILLMGSLMKRAARSFAIAISKFSDIRVMLYAPQEFCLPTEDVALLREAGVKVEQAPDLMTALSQVDVIYHAGQTTEAQDPLPESFALTTNVFSQCKSRAIILHPLPRLGSISINVDGLPQARYFQNARNGVPVRMALLDHVLGART